MCAHGVEQGGQARGGHGRVDAPRAGLDHRARDARAGLPRLPVEAMRERDPQLPPPLARRPAASAASPAWARQTGSSEPSRSARAPRPGPPRGSPLRVSAQPSASAARMLGAASQRAGRARPRAPGPVVGLEDRELDVDVDPGAPAAAAARRRRARGRAAPRPSARRRARSRRARRRTRAAAAASTTRRERARDRARASVAAPPRAQPRPPGRAPAGSPGRRASAAAIRRERRRAGRPRARSSSPSSALTYGVVLRRRAAGGDGQAHRARGAREVAVQLSQVGHPRVGGEVRFAVDHPLQLALGVLVAAELDERVDADRAADAPRARRPSASAPAEVVAGAARARRRCASAVGRARRAEHALGAGVEGRVAGLARPLQVGGGERRPQVLAAAARTARSAARRRRGPSAAVQGRRAAASRAPARGARPPRASDGETRATNARRRAASSHESH